jgi:hypothetical protein
VRGVGQDDRVAIGERQCLLGERDRFAAAGLRVLRPAIIAKPMMAYAGSGKGRAVTRITRDRPIEQISRIEEMLLHRPGKARQST